MTFVFNPCISCLCLQMFLTDFLDKSKSAILRCFFYCDSINPIRLKWLQLTGIMFTGPEEILRPFHGTPIGLIAGKLHLRVPSVSGQAE